MDLNHVRTFITLVEKKSITKAAMELNYAQSTITKHIHALEYELQAPLFEKHNRSNLTKIGELFYEKAKELYWKSEFIIQEINNEAQDNCVLRLAGLTHHCYMYYLPVLAKFQKRHKNCKLELVSCIIDEAVRKLELHEVDIILAGGCYLPKNVHTECIGYEDGVILGHPDIYALYDENKEQAFEEYPVLANKNSNYFNYGFLQRGMEFPNIIHCNNSELVYEGIKSGKYIGCACTARYRDDIKKGSIVVLDNLDPNLPVYLTMLKENRSQPLLKELFDMIKEYAS